MATVAQLQAVVTANTSQAEQGLARVDKSVKQTAQGGDNLGKSWGALGGIAQVAIGQVVANAFMTAMSAAVGFFQSTVTSAANFESTMSGVKAVLAPTADEFDALREMAIQLGADTAFSAQEAASAIEMLAQNGLNAQQILGGAADATVALAAATGSDLSTAANIATDAMMAWKLQSSDLTTVINGISGVTVASKFAINDYALALAQGGGKAAAFGVSLDDFNTAITATSYLFKSGSDAGTSFGTFLTRLVPQSNEARDAMKALGLITADGSNAFFDASGNMRSMSEIAGVLAQATAGLSDEQKNATLSVIFGNDAIRTAVGLADTGSEKFNQFAQQIGQVDAAAQAATRLDNFNGVLEQFHGALDSLKIVIGTALLPRLSQLFTWLTSLIDKLIEIASAVTSAANPFQEFAQQVAAVVGSLLGFSGAAESYGSGLVAAFAQGIAGAYSYVVSALSGIGDIVSYWLQPHSPPKIVPNLDQYGADAATVYFDGWASGDYSALQDLGSTIQQTLEGLVDAGVFSEQDVIPRVLGTQGALQDAINQLRETGSVSDDLVNTILDAAGPVGDTLRGYVNAYFDLESATRAVQDAQSELNRVQDEYNAKLAPLNGELDLIRQKKRALQDAQRIEQLNKKLADGSMTDTERQIALLEIEEIQKRQQIDAVERERDAAVDSAQVKLDAAKQQESAARDALATQQAAIDLTNRQNQLIGQQTQLLEQLARSASGGGKGGGGALGGLAKPNIPTPDATIKPEIDTSSIVDATSKFNDFKMAQVDAMTSASTESKKSSGIMATAFSALNTAFVEVQTVALSVWDIIQSYVPAAMQSIQNVIASVLSVILAFWNQNGADIISTLSANWETVKQIVNGAVELILNIIIGAWQLMASTIAAHQDEIVTILSATWLILSAIVEGALALINGTIHAALAIMSGDWEGAWAAIQNMSVTITLAIGKIIYGFLDIIAAGFGTSLAEIGQTWASNWDKFLVICSIIIERTVAAVSTFVGDLIAAFNGMLATAQQIWNDLQTAITSAVEGVKTFLGDTVDSITTAAANIGAGIIDGIKNGISAGWDALKRFVSQKATELLNAAKNTLGIQSPSTVFRDMIGKMIPAGIAEGITTSASMAVKAIQGLSSKLVAEAFDIQAQFQRARASAAASVADLMPTDDKGFKNLESRIHQLQKEIERGKNVEKNQLKLNDALAKREILLASVNAAQAELNAAEQRAIELQKIDGGLANDYYDMRVKHILEIAKLEDEKNKAKKQADRDRIQAQIDMLKAAQDLELKAFEAHLEATKEQIEKDAKDALAAIAKQTQDTIKDIVSRMQSVMRESLSGIAGLARGRADARRAIKDMLPDPAELDAIRNKMQELSDEEKRLQVTAQYNIDPAKREEAEQRLAEIARERAELAQELATEQRRQNAQSLLVQRAQAQLADAEKEALRLREIDPKLADEYYALRSSQILKLAELEEEMANAKTTAEKQFVAEQIRLEKEAQAAEMQLFNADADARRKQLAELAQDAASATTNIGQQFVEAMRQGLNVFTSGLSTFLKGIGVDITPTPFGYNPTSPVTSPNRGGTGNKPVSPIQNIFHIDARGSTMTEAQIKKIVNDSVNQAAAAATQQRKMY